MRVLLDENVDRSLRSQFDAGMEVLTVDECGWKGKKNGDLLRAAQVEFDVLVTMDRNLEYQQNLKAFALGFVVIRAKSNSYYDVMPLMPKVNAAVKTLKFGNVVHVSA